MKALVISPQPFFSPRGTPFSVYYRALVMAEKGVQIDLLTYGEGQDVVIPGVRIIRIPRVKALGEIKIGPSFPKLVLDVLLVLRMLSLLMVRRYDFVHAHEEAVFFCLLLKPIFRFKLLYDMHSSLPQQLSNFQFTRSRLLVDVFRILEDASLRAADVVITICPDLADYVRGRIRDFGKHFLIENSIFDPVRLAEPPIEQSGCPAFASRDPSLQLPRERRMVLYAGTLEPYQGIELLLRAFGLMICKVPEAFLLVVGGNPSQVDTYRSLSRTLGIDAAVAFTGQVPQAQAQRLTRLAEVLVSPRIMGTNTPLKIYQQLASGKPLVATRIYSHTQVLTDEVAFLVDATPESLADGIAEALGSGGESTARAQRAVELYQSRYARSIYDGKIMQALSLLI
jgi:glycosyltransferase involved in cell wall biosynthesis